MKFIVKLISSKTEKDRGCCNIEIKEIGAECCQNDSEEEKCCE